MARIRKQFRANDRAMMEKGLLMLTRLLSRDLRALDPIETQKLSTRALVFDDPTANPGSKPLSDAAELLKVSLTAKLLLTETV